MGKPVKILSSETLAKWKRKALRRRKTEFNYDDTWAELKLLAVIKSHEGLRRGLRPPFTKPAVKKDLRYEKGWKTKKDGND